ncbi:MAG: hypothetical protein ACJ756_14020, partial [Solirubrobacterales bacterium]
MAEQTTSSIVVSADPAAIMGVISDFEAYPTWAQGVKKAQGRLRALLHAIETVAGELSLEAVLRNVVEAACELANAQYGALG